MIAKKIGKFYQVGIIISLFVQMGCEIRIAEPTVSSEDGDCFNVRYLFNPANQAFAALVDLADDHYISLWEVQSLQRRLGVSIPLPP